MRLAATALVVAATLLAGCSEGGDGDGDPALTVYVSLPPSGDGGDAADGARMALDEAGGEAAGIPVTAEFLDAWGGAERWTPQQAAANARAATQDSAAIAYLGDFESGATRASLPVTNSARLLQVSPASASMDLVEAPPGEDELPPAQPGGSRTFGRVIPGDDAQAEAGAGWARQLSGPAGVESDGSEYGDAMVASFEEAFGFAIERVGAEQLLYYGGLPSSRPPEPKRSRILMVTDAQLGSGVDPLADGTVATSAALDPSQLPPAGQEFVAAFEEEYDRAPGRYAAYGYEAMAVILDSIDRASDPTDRPAVIEAFFETSDRDSILGTYSIDELGETTLDRMTGYEFGGGRPQPVDELGGSG